MPIFFQSPISLALFRQLTHKKTTPLNTTRIVLHVLCVFSFFVCNTHTQADGPQGSLCSCSNSFLSIIPFSDSAEDRLSKHSSQTAAKLTSQSSEIELTGKKWSTQVVHVYTKAESYILCFSFAITLSLHRLHKQTLKRRDNGHSFQPRLMNRGWPESVSHRSSAQHPQSSSPDGV